LSRILEGDEAVVRLGPDQALVLFELLARWEDGPPAFEHPAEEAGLWQVYAALQTQFVAIFDPEYRALVEAARARLAGA
jgi:hypothetical protein